MASHSGSDDDVSGSASALRRPAPPSDLAISIEQDFRALVDILSHEPEGSGMLDGEFLDHLRRAREAAQQGLRLSERLVKMAERAEDGQRGAR